MKIPGVLITSIIVALTAWLQSTYPEQWWIGGAVILLGAIGKLAELYLVTEPTVNERMTAPPSKTARWLLGG